MTEKEVNQGADDYVTNPEKERTFNGIVVSE